MPETSPVDRMNDSQPEKTVLSTFPDAFSYTIVVSIYIKI